MLALAFVVATSAPALAEWAYTAAALLGLLPILNRAAASARHGTPFSIETLMSVAAIGAMAIGESAEAAVVVFLFAVGELLENVATGWARAGIAALINIITRFARLERDCAVTEVRSSGLAWATSSQFGRATAYPPRRSNRGHLGGRRSSGDGRIHPVVKRPAGTVYAGSINANGLLRVRITRTAADNTIARIITSAETAMAAACTWR